MVFTEYTKKRIVYHHSHNNIVRALEGEEITVSKLGVWRFLKRYKETKTIERKKGREDLARYEKNCR